MYIHLLLTFCQVLSYISLSARPEHVLGDLHTKIQHTSEDFAIMCGAAPKLERGTIAESQLPQRDNVTVTPLPLAAAIVP